MGVTRLISRILCDWLIDLKLIPAGRLSAIGEYIGSYEPYATRHEALDRNEELQEEVRNAALSLLHQVHFIRSGKYIDPAEGLTEARQK